MRALATRAPAAAPGHRRRAAPSDGFAAVQRGAGNRAVGALLGEADDRAIGALLRETDDAVAGDHDASALLRNQAPVVRRCCGGGGPKCAKCAEEDDELRRTATGLDAGGALPDGVAAYLARSRGGGAPLVAGVRAPLERAFGRGLGQVRVHASPEAAWAARSVRARAFTLGKDIWFGAGEYRPGDPGGRRLLAHEVAHALEQRAVASLDGVRVGAVGDPAEARADRAADAVLAGERAPATADEEAVVRRYAISQVRRREQGGQPVVDVNLDTGIRYTVRRVCRLEQGTQTTVGYRPPQVRPGMDRTNIYVEISWCTGTRGHVTPGVDVPRAFQDAIQRVIQGALAGRRPDDVLRETTLTPFVDFAVAQSGGISVDGRIQVTVNGEGIQAGEGSLTFSRGPLDVGVTASGGSSSGITGAVTVSYTPGRTSERFDCPTTSRRRERHYQVCGFECTHGPIAPPPAREPERVPASASMYFEYASSGPNTRLNDAAATELRALLRQGYQVQSIRGYASPEGPLERRRGGRFQGNRTLSAERAQAAQGAVQRLCSEVGATGSCLVTPDAPVTGCGERFGGAPECESPQEGEVRTERQGRDVAAGAVRDFLADPAERARMLPADREALDRARTDEEKARIIYPYLRRASIELVRVVPAPRPSAGELMRPQISPDFFDCPADVLDAARPHLQRPGPRR